MVSEFLELHTHVTFGDEVNFERAHFEEEVDFSGAVFEHNANFSHCSFDGGAYFHDVTFNSATFEGSRFGGTAQFALSTFKGITTFRGCKFDGSGGFARTVFEDDVDFLGVSFQQALANAYDREFDCADFTNARFRGRVEFGLGRFKNIARFTEAVFEGVVDLSNSSYDALADFKFCYFKSVTFLHSTFKQTADFRNTTFTDFAQFSRASFEGELDFTDSTFKGLADFNEATFRDRVRFAGYEDNAVFTPSSSLDLQFARFEKPELVSFYNLYLRPHWFVNLNTSRFDFTRVAWSIVLSRRDRDHTTLRDEIDCLKRKKIASPFRLLSIACRRLAINAEENHRYEEASEFRLWSMRTGQINKGTNFLHWLFYLASGYGEQVGRAAIVLLGIWGAFAISYLATGHIKIPPSHRFQDYANAFIAAFTYSLQVMTLQRPDRPVGALTPLLVGFETILGPVQAALLALAIRRKFMR